MEKSNIENVKITTLVSIVLHGANDMGERLTKILAEQGSRVIVIDEYTKATKERIKELKKIRGVEFVDFSGVEALFNTLNRFDYLFYMLSSTLDDDKEYKSKDLLKESNYLNITLKAATKYHAKVALVSTVKYNKSFNEKLNMASQSQPAPYSPEEIQKYAETVAAEFHDKSSLNVRIIRLGTIFGDQIQKVDDPIIGGLINSFSDRNQLEIEGDGLDAHFIINVEDALYGILKLTFDNSTSGEVITLANNHEYTTLSIAYKILELSPSPATIKFLPAPENKPLLIGHYSPAPNASEFGWQQKVALETTLNQVLEMTYKGKNLQWKPVELVKASPSQNDNQPKSKVVTTAENVKTPLGRLVDVIAKPLRKIKNSLTKTKVDFKDSLNFKNAILLSITTVLLGLLFYFLIGPLVIISLGGYYMYQQANAAYKDVSELDLEAAAPHFEKFNSYFERTEKSVTQLEWAFNLTGQSELYSNLSEAMYGVKYASEGSYELIIALQPLADYANEFEPGISFEETTPTTTREYRDQLVKLRENRDQIQNAVYKLTLASDIVKGLDPEVFPNSMQTFIVNIKANNQKASELLEPAANTVTFLPELLGVDSRQRYLILLQNPSELRSTGGWLSSYALVGIESGQIRQLDVDDIYNLEGQLTLQGNKYEAPKEMKEALNLNNWSFSLSNWSPDFATVSNEAEFFIKAAGKAQKIDGVIAVDINVIEKLLQKWGSLEVPGEKEPVTADNLYSKILAIHDSFTPGSTRKTTFLANLASTVFKKVFASKISGYQEISSVIYESLQEKHILISLDNQEANLYFERAGWSGNLTDEYTTSPVAIEWNWGANKANLFLERNSELNLNIVDKDNLSYKYSIALKNNSESRAYPQGDYQNYERIYLPQEAQITSVQGMKDNKYQIYFENGYKVVAGWYNVPIQTTRTLEIKYNLVRKENDSQFPIRLAGNKIYMDLLLFKQPGLENDPIKLDIAYPNSWAVVENADLNQGTNLLSTQTELLTDLEYGLVWEFK
ncbi:MAG: hypothetical protein Fur003_1030 [Candidatus Dojkabacteria bacterium]